MSSWIFSQKLVPIDQWCGNYTNARCKGMQGKFLHQRNENNYIYILFYSMRLLNEEIYVSGLWQCLTLHSIQECSLLCWNRCLRVVLLRIENAPKFVQNANSVKVPLGHIQLLKMCKQNWKRCFGSHLPKFGSWIMALSNLRMELSITMSGLFNIVGTSTCYKVHFVFRFWLT